MATNNLTTSVSHVRCFTKGTLKAEASGFFYSHGGGLYFITNRHVVIDENEGYYPDELRLRLHTNFKDIRQNEDHSIPLYELKKPLWREHSDRRAKVDVVALPLDSQQVQSRFTIKPFTQSDHVPDNVNIGIGEDVLVMGYPLGFHDTFHNLPIIRNALIASVYPVPFEHNPYILIDAHLHEGTSGSPVLTKPTNIVNYTDGTTAISNTTTMFLVGVHSATFILNDQRPEDESGLNVVWFASMIPEIIAHGR